MGIFVFFAIVIFIVVLVSKSSTGQAQSVYKKLMKSGLQARGIVLSVSQTGTRQPGGMRRANITLPLVRFERRDVRIDVEIPGEAPFELRTSALIPTGLSGDVMPGATLELRVDPRLRKQRNASYDLAIVGPGIGLPVATSLQTGKP